jgi:hypothetical protein
LAGSRGNRVTGAAKFISSFVRLEMPLTAGGNEMADVSQCAGISLCGSLAAPFSASDRPGKVAADLVRPTI